MGAATGIVDYYNDMSKRRNMADKLNAEKSFINGYLCYDQQPHISAERKKIEITMTHFRHELRALTDTGCEPRIHFLRIHCILVQFAQIQCLASNMAFS